MSFFEEKLSSFNFELRKQKIEVLQVNMGRLCNLVCVHCHVESGPTRTRENMNQKTLEAVIRLMDRLPDLNTLDITGGAPELNPHFKRLVAEGKRHKLGIIDRCNLTVFYESGMSDLPKFLAQNQVQIVASLPCYEKENVDKQRGRGTFDKSIQGLKWLNDLGYGKEGTELVLNLVYNPVGAHLPPPEEELEQTYKERLKEDFDIVFNRLYTITNMPITRYAKYLKALNQYEAYIELLINRFNPHTLEGLMCRNTLSLSWDGKLYDCDFNQALGMEVRNGRLLTVFDVTAEALENFRIKTGEHCFGCTAGRGSSCQGALTG